MIATLVQGDGHTATLLGCAYAFARRRPAQGRMVLLGFTGPLESTTPTMAAGAELAFKEASDSGLFLDGSTIVPVRGDSTCADAAAAAAAAEGLVAEGVVAIFGADCSGVTASVLQNVARPNGLVLFSPSATSPALSEAPDDGLFFRTAPSDARQGVVMTEILLDRGVTDVALTQTNNDYGKGLADSFTTAFQAPSGTVSITVPHEDGKAGYSAEVASLAAGSDVLVVAGYVDQGGAGIMQASIDTGAFETFVLPDGMAGQPIVDRFGSAIDGSFGQAPGTDSSGTAAYQSMAEAAGFEGSMPFSAESYDAGALMVLAMQAAGSTASRDWAPRVMDLANSPGEPILPGELARALDLLSQGQDIDYVGATAVELIGAGESAGSFREIEIRDGAIETVGYR